MSWIWLIVALVVGAFGGYILKDQLTDEYKSEVKIRKVKIRGEGNRMDLEIDQEITHRRLTLKERRANRKEKRLE